MKKTLLLFFLLFPMLRCYSQLVIDDNFLSSTLENKMSIFRDSTNKMPLTYILQHRAELPFTISKDPVPNFVYDHTRRWVNFTVINKSKETRPFFIRIHFSYMDTVDFYLVKQNKIIEETKFRWKIPFFYRTSQLSRLPVAQFQISPGDSTEVYFMARRVVSSWNLPIEVFANNKFFERERMENTIYGLLAGGMLLTVLMAMFLFGMIRERLYLFYMFYIISTSMSILGIAGYTNYYLGSKFTILTGPEAYSFFLVNTLIFNILFTQSLFNITFKNAKPLYVAGRTILIFCIILDVLFIYDSKYVYHQFVSPLISLTSFLYVFIVLFTIIYSLFQKKLLGLFYLIAFLPLLTLIIINVLSDISIIPRSPYLVFMAPPCVLFEIVVLFLGLAYRLYEFQKNRQLLERKLVSQQIEIQETERKHIAQDLHDDLGATLAMLNRKAKKENFSEENQEIIEKALKDLRNISRNLLPADFEAFGLVSALEKYIGNLNEQEKVKFTFINFGQKVPLRQEVELNIYRIITELANNIMKHSEAKNGTIQLIYHDDHLFVSVEDDGKGLEISENNLGIGLKNVISRIEYLQARVLEKGNGSSSSFVFEIPYEPHKL